MRIVIVNVKIDGKCVWNGPLGKLELIVVNWNDVNCKIMIILMDPMINALKEGRKFVVRLDVPLLLVAIEKKSCK